MLQSLIIVLLGLAAGAHYAGGRPNLMIKRLVSLERHQTFDHEPAGRLGHDGGMPPRQDWREMMQQHGELLERRTGAGVAEWRDRIAQQAPHDEAALRSWLKSQGVDGYPQQLLVFETFGYPDFLTATADDLIDAQYADRPALRPVLDRLLQVAESLTGEVTVQARKGFVTLQTTRRKFAVIKPATKTRIDLGLRIDTPPGSQRFQPADPARSNDMPTKVAIVTPQDVDEEVTDALRQAYAENQ